MPPLFIRILIFCIGNGSFDVVLKAGGGGGSFIGKGESASVSDYNDDGCTYSFMIILN